MVAGERQAQETRAEDDTNRQQSVPTPVAARTRRQKAAGQRQQVAPPLLPAEQTPAPRQTRRQQATSQRTSAQQQSAPPQQQQSTPPQQQPALPQQQPTARQLQAAPLSEPEAVPPEQQPAPAQQQASAPEQEDVLQQAQQLQRKRKSTARQATTSQKRRATAQQAVETQPAPSGPAPGQREFVNSEYNAVYEAARKLTGCALRPRTVNSYLGYIQRFEEFMMANEGGSDWQMKNHHIIQAPQLSFYLSLAGTKCNELVVSHDQRPDRSLFGAGLSQSSLATIMAAAKWWNAYCLRMHIIKWQAWDNGTAELEEEPMMPGVAEKPPSSSVDLATRQQLEDVFVEKNNPAYWRIVTDVYKGLTKQCSIVKNKAAAFHRGHLLEARREAMKHGIEGFMAYTAVLVQFWLCLRSAEFLQLEFDGLEASELLCRSTHLPAFVKVYVLRSKNANDCEPVNLFSCPEDPLVDPVLHLCLLQRMTGWSSGPICRFISRDGSTARLPMMPNRHNWWYAKIFEGVFPSDSQFGLTSYMSRRSSAHYYLRKLGSLRRVMAIGKWRCAEHVSAYADDIRGLPGAMDDDKLPAEHEFCDVRDPTHHDPRKFFDEDNTLTSDETRRLGQEVKSRVASSVLASVASSSSSSSSSSSRAAPSSSSTPTPTPTPSVLAPPRKRRRCAMVQRVYARADAAGFSKGEGKHDSQLTVMASSSDGEPVRANMLKPHFLMSNAPKYPKEAFSWDLYRRQLSSPVFGGFDALKVPSVAQNNPLARIYHLEKQLEHYGYDSKSGHAYERFERLLVDIAGPYQSWIHGHLSSKQVANLKAANKAFTDFVLNVPLPSEAFVETRSGGRSRSLVGRVDWSAKRSRDQAQEVVDGCNKFIARLEEKAAFQRKTKEGAKMVGAVVRKLTESGRLDMHVNMGAGGNLKVIDHSKTKPLPPVQRAKMVASFVTLCKDSGNLDFLVTSLVDMVPSLMTGLLDRLDERSDRGADAHSSLGPPVRVGVALPSFKCPYAGCTFSARRKKSSWTSTTSPSATTATTLIATRTASTFTSATFGTTPKRRRPVRLRSRGCSRGA